MHVGCICLGGEKQCANAGIEDEHREVVTGLDEGASTLVPNFIYFPFIFHLLCSIARPQAQNAPSISLHGIRDCRKQSEATDDEMGNLDQDKFGPVCTITHPRLVRSANDLRHSYTLCWQFKMRWTVAKH